MHTHLDNIRLKQKSKIRDLLNLGLIILLILFSVQISLAQNQANIWLFGDYVGLDFNTGEPVIIPYVNTQYFNASATMCDPSGNLLFTFNANTIRNKNGQIMQNGDGLIGHKVASMGALIVQKPGSNNLYYLFTVPRYTSYDGMYYSVVNMNLDGGLGAVTNEKNIPLEAAWDVLEKLVAVKHENGTDIWIITRKFKDNCFASFLLTKDGIITQPILSPAKNSDFYEMLGNMKVSHDKKHLVVAYTDGQGIGALRQAYDICNFNSSTGVIDFLFTLTKNDGTTQKIFEPWAIEFSPDSKLLYLTFFNEAVGDLMELYQYDMQYYEDSLQLLQSEIKIATGPVNGLQLARDGKIYCTGDFYDHYDYVSVIHEPWKRGTVCNYEADAIYMGSNKVFEFLPNQLMDYLLPFEWDTHCSHQPITFQPNFIPEPKRIEWDFGDPLSGDDNFSEGVISCALFRSTWRLRGGGERVLSAYSFQSLWPTRKNLPRY